MPIFLPLTLGGLALTALGLGVKWILEELQSRPAFPEGTRARDAWARHQEVLKAVRAARQRVTERARAYGERQGRAWQETVEPFRVLLERLERWEHARAAEVLTPEGLAALSALPKGAVSRTECRDWPLLGVGAEAPPSLRPVLEWLDRGWLMQGAPPVVVDAISLYPAATCSPEPPDETQAVRAFHRASGELSRVVVFLDAVHRGLEALDVRVATLHGKASAQLAYLDAASFEEGRAEPRERLVRLGALMSVLAEALRLPVLQGDGSLAPLPEPLAD
jgi:hypothetical protein